MIFCSNAYNKDTMYTGQSIINLRVLTLILFVSLHFWLVVLTNNFFRIDNELIQWTETYEPVNGGYSIILFEMTINPRNL